MNIFLANTFDHTTYIDAILSNGDNNVKFTRDDTSTDWKTIEDVSSAAEALGVSEEEFEDAVKGPLADCDKYVKSIRGEIYE